VNQTRMGRRRPPITVLRDVLLTVVTLCWATGTITASMRDYFDAAGQNSTRVLTMHRCP
jgi:hypothetical protein